MWDELRKLLKHTSIYGLGGLLGKLVGFLLIPLYTHYLRPAEYGTLELLDLTLSLTAMLLNAWMAAPLVRFYYEYENKEEKAKVVSTALIAASISAAGLSAAGWRFAKGLSSLILKSPGFPHYIHVICITFFLFCVDSVTWNYLRARQRSTLVASLNLLSLVVTLSLNIYFIVVLHLGVLGVLYSSLTGSLLVTSIQVILTLREVGLSFDFRKLRQFAAFGAPLVFTNIAGFVLNFSDRFFLQHLTNVSSVGVYALGYKFGFMLNFLLIQPFSMIWSARMYEIAKKENAGPMFARFGTYLCLALATGALTISLVIKDVVNVVAAEDFHAAYQIVPLIALSYVFHGMTGFFQSGILIQKRTVYMGLTGLAGTGVNLLLNYFLIRWYGLMGAAWATLLSFALVAALAFYFSSRVYPVPYRVSRLAMPIVAAVPVYLASTSLTVASPILSIATKLLFVPGFLLILYFLGFFEPEEIGKLRSVIGVFIARYGWSAANSTGS